MQQFKEVPQEEEHPLPWQVSAQEGCPEGGYTTSQEPCQYHHRSLVRVCSSSHSMRPTVRPHLHTLQLVTTLME